MQPLQCRAPDCAGDGERARQSAGSLAAPPAAQIGCPAPRPHGAGSLLEKNLFRLAHVRLTNGLLQARDPPVGTRHPGPGVDRKDSPGLGPEPPRGPRQVLADHRQFDVVDRRGARPRVRYLELVRTPRDPPGGRVPSYRPTRRSPARRAGAGQELPTRAVRAWLRSTLAHHSLYMTCFPLIFNGPDTAQRNRLHECPQVPRAHRGPATPGETSPTVSRRPRAAARCEYNLFGATGRSSGGPLRRDGSTLLGRRWPEAPQPEVPCGHDRHSERRAIRHAPWDHVAASA